MVYFKEIGTTLWQLDQSQRVVGCAEMIDCKLSLYFPIEKSLSLVLMKIESLAPTGVL